MPFFKDLKQKKTRSVTEKMLVKEGRKDFKNISQSIAESPNTSPKHAIHRSCSYADEETILLNAVAREDIPSIRRVLENGRVNVNVIRHPGLSPLHHACINGNLNIVKLLLRYDADLNLKSSQNMTPLKLAASQGHFELSKYLIEMGATESDIVDGVQENNNNSS